MTNKNPKRARRTKEQIDNDILDAAESLVKKKGFVDIPVTTFLNEAGIDPNVFYRRYQNIYEIYDKLTKKYDFWINNNIELTQLNVLGDKLFMANVLKSLQNDLNKNIVMQKLLLWELSDHNETTKRSAGMRDTFNQGLLLYYKEKLQSGKFETYGIIALMIAGIYYLTLQQGIATFCTVDFSSQEGKRVLYAATDQLVDMLFMQVEQKKDQVRMVKEMCNDGISHENICRYLNIEPVTLEQILKQI